MEYKLDPTFGPNNNGIIITDISGNNDRVTLMVLNSNDNIYITGFGRINNQSDLIVIKYNSNGELDNTFGTNG